MYQNIQDQLRENILLNLFHQLKLHPIQQHFLTIKTSHKEDTNLLPSHINY